MKNLKIIFLFSALLSPVWAEGYSGGQEDPSQEEDSSSPRRIYDTDHDTQQDGFDSISEPEEDDEENDWGSAWGDEDDTSAWNEGNDGEEGEGEEEIVSENPRSAEKESSGEGVFEDGLTI